MCMNSSIHRSGKNTQTHRLCEKGIHTDSALYGAIDRSGDVFQ